MWTGFADTVGCGVGLRRGSPGVPYRQRVGAAVPCEAVAGRRSERELRIAQCDAQLLWGWGVCGWKTVGG